MRSLVCPGLTRAGGVDLASSLGTQVEPPLEEIFYLRPLFLAGAQIGTLLEMLLATAYWLVHVDYYCFSIVVACPIWNYCEFQF
jgi:hypothetical protein